MIEEGPADGDVLWEAVDPLGEAASGGEFRVGVPDDFAREATPLTTRLPDRFAVRAALVAEDGDELSMTRVAPLSGIADFEPERAGEFYTRGGEGMTREEINAQAHYGG